MSDFIERMKQKAKNRAAAARQPQPGPTGEALEWDAEISADPAPSGRFRSLLDRTTEPAYAEPDPQSDEEIGAEGERALQEAQEKAEENRLHTVRGKIKKALHRGDNVYKVLLIACKGIGTAAKDKYFFDDVRTALETVYGIGNLDTIPLRAALESRRKGVQILKNRLKGKYGTGAKGSIGEAIRAMEKEVADTARELERVEEEGPGDRIEAIEALEKTIQLWKDELEEGQKKPYQEIAAAYHEQKEAEAAAAAAKRKKKAPDSDELPEPPAPPMEETDGYDLMENDYDYEGENGLE